MKKLLFENIGLKISAVLISVFLWFFITSRGQSELSIEVPIEFKNIPQGLEMISYSARTVSVTVKGHERIMKNIKSSDIRVFADLEKAKKGEGIYYINRDEVKLPYAMNVLSVSPSSVRVRFDETASKNVPVRPSITGAPAAGYFVSSITAEPKEIAVSGQRAEVKKINELKTEPLEITGINKGLTRELNLDLGGANVRVDNDTVKVTINVTRRKR